MIDRSLDDLKTEIEELWDRADHCKDPEKAHELNLQAHELVVKRRTLLLSEQ